MCNNHIDEKLCEKTMQEIRHPKEKKFFIVASFLTILAFLWVFFGSFFREEIIQEMKTEIIENYKSSLSEEEKAKISTKTPEEILTKIPAEQKENLENLEFYYWWAVLGIPFAILLLVIYQTGKTYGENRANGVLLTKNQYPVVYDIFENLAKKAGFKETPELFLINGNGLINAYATCVPGYRNFAAIYSDLVDGCIKNNDIQALKMILWHELWHIKYNHVKWWYHLLTFVGNLPIIDLFVGSPLGRSREYSADQLGVKLSWDESGKSLMILAAGKHAFTKIDLDEYEKNQFKWGFWVNFTNFFSSHPITAWRIGAIKTKKHWGLFFCTCKNKKH